MKKDRTERLGKARVKNNRQGTLAKAFGMDRQRIKSFNDEDRERTGDLRRLCMALNMGRENTRLRGISSEP